MKNKMNKNFMKSNFKFQSNFKLRKLLDKVITLAFEYNWILRRGTNFFLVENKTDGHQNSL